MSMPVSIRPLTSQDLPEIVFIHLAAFPESALTHLGTEAVHRYYQWLMDGPHKSVILGAFATSANTTDPERMAGFCFGGLFRQATMGFLRQNRAFLVWKILTGPWHLTNPLFRERIQTVGSAWLRQWRRQPPVEINPSSLPGKSFGILSIAVHPDYQGQRVGHKLMARSEAVALFSGFNAMHLTVHPDNGSAVRFYEHLGFERVQSQGLWNGFMRKQLTSETPERVLAAAGLSDATKS